MSVGDELNTAKEDLARAEAERDQMAKPRRRLTMEDLRDINYLPRVDLQDVLSSYDPVSVGTSDGHEFIVVAPKGSEMPDPNTRAPTTVVRSQADVDEIHRQRLEDIEIGKQLALRDFAVRPDQGPTRTGIGTQTGAIRQHPSVNFVRGVGVSDSEVGLEIGTAVASPWTSWTRREYNADLIGYKGLRVYQKMAKSDGTVRGMLRLAKTPVLAGQWGIKPASENKRDVNIANFVWANLTDWMSTSFPQFITEALLMLQYGYYCADSETEILTREGWKSHDQLRGDEEVLTLNAETGLSEWQQLVSVNQFEYDGAMLSIESKQHSSLTTLDHNWVVEPTHDRGAPFKFKKSWELNTNHRLIKSAPRAEYPVDKKYDDDFVELLGWWVSEGSVQGTSKHVVIWQSPTANPANCDRIRGLFRRLFGVPGPLREGHTWIEEVHPGTGMLLWRLNVRASRSILALAPRKELKLSVVQDFTKAQLQLFVDVAMLGDGSATEGSVPYYGQSDPDRLDAIELALILLGISTRRSVRSDGFHCLWIHQRTRVQPFNPNGKSHSRWVEYSGTVWCPTVPNKTWLARRRGTVYFTGNCFEKVFAHGEDVTADPRAKGKIVWKKLAPRHPMDVKEWFMDINGGPLSVDMWAPPVQVGDASGNFGTSARTIPNTFEGGVIQAFQRWINIPIDKLLVFSFDKEAGDIEGTSILRSAYKHWYMKDALYKIDAIAKERHGIGIPVVKLPMGFSEQDLKNADQLGRNLRTNDRAHVVLPPNWDLVFAELKGQPVDCLRSIEHHDNMILQGVLGQFMNKASTQVEEQHTIFLKATRFTADILADVLNSYAIPQLVNMNWGRNVYPKIYVKRIGEQEDWRTQSFTIRNLVGAGVIVPDDAMESALRDEMGLPPIQRETARLVREQPMENLQRINPAPTELPGPGHQTVPNQMPYPPRTPNAPAATPGSGKNRSEFEPNVPGGQNIGGTPQLPRVGPPRQAPPSAFRRQPLGGQDRSGKGGRRGQ